MRISRRIVLGGALAGLARAGWADAPLRSPLPLPRPPLPGVVAAADALVAAARLGGAVSYVVADAQSGRVLAARDGARAMPPASTAKLLTSLYALDRLGPGYRFTTRLIATGPLRGGRLAGDLVLAGGGDATLHTDQLVQLAKALRGAGVTSVAGRFLVWGGALPFAVQIAADQPVHAGYNPAVGGLNLNFNRVYFEWKPDGGGYALTMDARSDSIAPRVQSARIALADRQAPLFTYAQRSGHEEWTVAQSALGQGGSRWLPVRRPDSYAGDVFRTLARAQGIALPPPEAVAHPPGGSVLAEHRSAPLTDMLRDMLRHSTNVTAEAVGMGASIAAGRVPDGIAASGRAMGDWLGSQGVPGVRCIDHSGLGVDTHVSAESMVAVLAGLAPHAGLRGLLRPFGLPQVGGKANPLKVVAKTGTLNFVSTLAGYVATPAGADLAFAIFAADLARRAAAGPVEAPPGGRAWLGRARTLQQQLIAGWGRTLAG
jgi:D-alanyl-D-alanine carboxypeptidase/D-alanyl-D-alanine-endopeptidase (penicillin-binding protein 4)